MLLVIDIGNTNISCGIFKGNKIVKKFIIPTKDYSFLQMKRSLGKFAIDDCIICSVVPRLTLALNRDSNRLLKRRPFILGGNIKVPINNLYRKPEQVGGDRLVNAYAGVMLYGAPLIIIDFGTALTFDLVSKNREYLGGLIMPGLEISLDVLARRTALLPKITLAEPKELIGRDTENSVLSGIVYGFAGSIEYLVDRLNKKIGKRAKVIGTGGDIDLISKYCRRFDKIDKDLTLKGLNLIYKCREQ